MRLPTRPSLPAASAGVPPLAHCPAPPGHVCIAPSPVGMLLAAHSGRGICAVFLGDSAASLSAALQHWAPGRLWQADTPLGRAAHAQVVARLDDPHATLQLPLDLAGTAFERRVWAELGNIPAGQTRTYKQLAQFLEVRGGARAVGSACGKNSVCILVPCHRVLRGDGGLGGFRWGLAAKRALLAREAQVGGVAAAN